MTTGIRVTKARMLVVEEWIVERNQERNGSVPTGNRKESEKQWFEQRRKEKKVILLEER